MTPHSGYGYAGLSIRVTSSERSLLDWLDEFLAPAFSSEPAARHAARIDARIDATEYRRILRRGAVDPPESIACFSVDGEFESHPRWVSEDGDLLCHDAGRELFYTFEPSDGAAGLIAAAEGGAARIGLLRLVREFATAHCLRNGLLHIHAAAFSLGGRGVVMIGPKAAGKTSLLINALRTGRVEFVTNDRLFIDLRSRRADGASGRPRLLGMPTIVNVREDGLALFPDVRDRFLETPFDRDWTRSECRDGIRAQGSRRDRWPPSLSPIQFCEEIGVGALASVAACAFVVPCISSEVETFALEPLDRESAANAIYRGIFRSATPQSIPRAYRVHDDDSRLLTEAEIQRSCRALAGELACFRCLLGPNAYGNPQLANEFVRLAAASLGPRSADSAQR